jgi:hypothetical protein
MTARKPAPYQRKAQAMKPMPKDLLQDGIPPLVPSAGHATWVHWFADGRIAHHMVEILPALPAGHYHVATYRLGDDDSSTLCRLSPAPVPVADVQAHVVELVESLSKGASHFVWLPSEVPGTAPSAVHPRIVELS